MNGSRILLVIAGGIAAYKSLDLIRRLREIGGSVQVVMTGAATHFVTPLSVETLTGGKVHLGLFDDPASAPLDHINLSRDVDLIVVAPATADLMARMASGMANDLASAILLATQVPVLVAPAMNPAMWSNAATQANVATLEARGVFRVGPGCGDTACGESGAGRMAEVSEIIQSISRLLSAKGTESRLPTSAMGERSASLVGRRVLVTSGPTHEPIDPVRFIANRSSGRQGFAIAEALVRRGADVTLVSGPTALDAPTGAKLIRVETACDMLAACRTALPVDVAVCAAAVADWRVVDPPSQKLKKSDDADAAPPVLRLERNPDILATLSQAGPDRPELVVGFAAETENVVVNATAKRQRKGCDWILANDVSHNGNGGTGSPFGASRNTVHFISANMSEDWPTLSKAEVADRLADRIAQAFDVSTTGRSS